MNFNILGAGVLFILNWLLDAYIYNSLSRDASQRSRHCRKWYLLSAVLIGLMIILCVVLPRRSGDNTILVFDMWMLFAVIALFFAKLLYTAIDMLSYIPRLWHHKRWNIISKIAIIVSWSALALMAWGSLINRNRISITKTEVASKAIPSGWDGARIVHISDLHCGTWGKDSTFMSRLIDKINSMEADMIIFSGDMVNRQSDEMSPFIKTLTRLEAPLGVYAVRGNHDYGDYRQWKNPAEYNDNRAKLDSLYNLTGIRLLSDTTILIKCNGDTMGVTGVENISSKKIYHSYGSLERARKNLTDGIASILVTHDPTHWTSEVKTNQSLNIPLTLSGHTHAMQIQLAGHTPASLTTETPWGLYDDGDGHYLYVNRGAGTVGMPMRIGATPEITVITLRSCK